MLSIKDNAKKIIYLTDNQHTYKLTNNTLTNHHFVCLFEVFGRDCFMQFPDNIHWAAASVIAVICRP
jgi:hypothetical protein